MQYISGYLFIIIVNNYMYVYVRQMSYFLISRSEKHPEKLELTEASQSLQGHLLSQAGLFEGNVTVNVRKCKDDILYQMDITILKNAYICFGMLLVSCNDNDISLKRIFYDNLNFLIVMSFMN